MGEEVPPQSEIILYQTEDGRTRIQCRFENETIWLTQALIAELFQKDIRTINELFLLTQPAHLQKLQGRKLEGDVRRAARADFIRSKLNPN